MECKIKETERK